MSVVVHSLKSFGSEEQPTAASSPFPIESNRCIELQLGLSWLLKLRWGAVFGQLVVLLLTKTVLGLDLPYVPLLSLIAFTAFSNIEMTFRRHSAAWRLPVVLAMDATILTVMLAASGGPSNPFTVFYLVHVALAALLLDARLAWALVLLTIFSFGSLFFASPPAQPFRNHAGWSIHLLGMWIAYVLAAVFIAFFVGRVSRAIRQRDRQLAHVTSLAAQNERLASLASFSANAAHELGSPLATIGLAAKELSIAIARGAPQDILAEDANLVCREVSRCREILADLSARAGESAGEMPRRTTPEGVMEELERLMVPAVRTRLMVEYESEAARRASLIAPVKTLAQILHNLIRNALEAHEESGATSPVELRVDTHEQLCMHVLDRGPGFSREVREKLGEPFVTTKSARGGLGLGVYLARSYAERTGGHLLFHAREGGGADVELCLPRDAVRGEP